MKKVSYILALMIGASSISIAHAADDRNTTYINDHFLVNEWKDEFSGKIDGCQLDIRSKKRSTPRLSIFNSRNGDLKLGGSIGRINASGIKVKIDDGKIYEYGESYPGGDNIYPEMPKDFLTQLAKGNKIVLKIVPENQFSESKTGTYSLSGSAKAVNAFNACLKKVIK